jgi:predicted transcriptional regulator
MRLDDENASFRFNQDGLRKFMGDLEVEIMELVWKKANPTVTVRDIYELLRQKRPIAYTTVMTTMVRLREKGILKDVDKAGLAICYAPEQSRDTFLQNVVSKVLGIFLDQFPDECESYLAKKSARAAAKKPSTAKKR